MNFPKKCENFFTQETRLSTKNYQILMNGLREKCKNPPFCTKWQNLGQIWVNFGQKGPILNFPIKFENVISFRLQRLGLVQKLQNSNEWIAKKCAKTSIFGHFGPKWPILDCFWPKFTKREFFQKSA